MTGDIRLNVIAEITKNLEDIDEESNTDVIDMINGKDPSEKFDRNNYDIISEENDFNSEDLILDKKEKDNFLYNLSVDFNYENYNGINNIVKITI